MMMKRKSDIDIFDSTNSLKVLSYLANNPGKEFLGNEVQKATALSRAGVYVALRELIRQNLVLKTQKGKFNMYSVAYQNPITRQFKVLKSIVLLKHAISRLRPLCKQIVLYGSTARGEDDSHSDIDLFILSHTPEAIRKVLASIRIKRKIQSVIKSPTDFVEFKEKERVFYDEISRGIILWEQTE